MLRQIQRESRSDRVKVFQFEVLRDLKMRMQENIDFLLCILDPIGPLRTGLKTLSSTALFTLYTCTFRWFYMETVEMGNMDSFLLSIKYPQLVILVL